MKKHWFWLIILILAATALRLAWLDQQSLWYDEGVTWMLSQMPLSQLIDWTAADIQPPLYYLLIWTTDIIFSDSEWALRFPSIVFGILTIPLIYTLGRRLASIHPPAHPSRPSTIPPALHQPANQLTPHPPIQPSSFIIHHSSFALFPFLAAFFFTVSPLMIYYSQEARMYTLLTFEATLASYLLLKIVHPTVKETQASSRLNLRFLNPLLYALVSAAALYTHYFAAFLLVAHAIYAAIILWSSGTSRTKLFPLLLAFGGSALLFAPWLPILLARLGDDPSYWPGALKLNEAIRKVAISFIAGETVFEQTGWWLTLAFLVLIILSLICLLTPNQPATQPLNHSSNQPPTHPNHPSSSFIIHHSSLFLILWLFVPLVLILTLSYQSPKFNPRYALLAWPALALLLAQLLTHLITRPYALRFTFYATHLLFALTIAFVLAISSFSLFNWFSDPRFSKDDFQALAQFVKERKKPDETVLLSSGHLFPVWAYYYGWDGWTPLPWMLRLDVNRVTTLSMANTIAEAVEGQAGVWLVTWQDEVIDPTGVVPFWLDRIGERQQDAGDFWGVGLKHWQLNPRRFDRLRDNPIQREANLNFADQVDLLGYTQLNDSELVLFWRPRQPLPDDLVFTLDLIDGDGFNWSRHPLTGRLGSDDFPPSRWPIGETIITHHQLPWQIGTPPGLYIAEVELGAVAPSAAGSTATAAGDFAGWDILDAQGRPQRRTGLLEAINLSDLVEPDSGPLPQDDEPLVDLFPIIGLRRSILLQESAQPGDRILLALLWQAGEYNMDDISVTFDLIDSTGVVHQVGSSFTPSRRFNLPRWQSGDMVLGQYWLDIPPETAPGPATLQLHIINVTAYPYDEVFPFDEIEITPTERNFKPPAQVDMPLGANFSNQATLIGADCAAGCRAAPGESLSLTLYWRAEASFDTSYTVFTHALDAGETVVINADHLPPKPTTGWVPNEIIIDPITLVIPGDLSPGTYPIEVGLYNAADPAFSRLPLAGGDNRLILPQPITVTN
ncbi:MAG: glycosyltransferase family 39 protein [Anaerolineae bacterium]|nr:glycosyltransferase family 39 protein [Anaerolineae bacterium]